MELVRELLRNPAATGLIGVLVGAVAGVMGTHIAARAANRRARWELGVRAAIAEWEMHLRVAKATHFPPLSHYVAVTARLVDQLLTSRDLTAQRVKDLAKNADELSDELIRQLDAAERRRMRTTTRQDTGPTFSQSIGGQEE